MIDPGFIFSTIDLEIKIGAGRPGIRAVVMTASATLIRS